MLFLMMHSDRLCGKVGLQSGHGVTAAQEIGLCGTGENCSISSTINYADIA